MPGVIDQVALARLYGEPLFALPHDLYIPPDALQVFLEAFEGPLDLLLSLSRSLRLVWLCFVVSAVFSVCVLISLSVPALFSGSCSGSGSRSCSSLALTRL